MHLRHVSFLQTVDRGGEFLAQSFVFELPEWIHVRLEGEDERFRRRESVEGLSFAADERLERSQLIISDTVCRPCEPSQKIEQNNSPWPDPAPP